MDTYFKKEISYNFEGKKFVFNVAETLFSTFDLDHGTDVLLRSIDTPNPKSILDIGCGYGPIGIILAKKYNGARVLMVGRDLLAVRYAQENAKKNGVEVEVLGSVGLEKVEGKFDLIVSNIPAKIGDGAIKEEFILKPMEKLNPGGELWVVVVNALNRLIPKIGRQYELNLKEVRKRAGHSVYKIKRG